nr:DMT family transporter [Robbsia betulipollinis]
MLVILAALWGASFLFIRISATDFGPIPLMTVRVTVAALFMSVIFFLKKGGVRGASGKILPIFVIGVLNQAIPFCLFAYAELSLSAGVTSVVNATTPLWASLIAFFWLGDRLTRGRIAGLLLGFLGVVILVWHDLARLGTPSGMAPLAVLAATFFYGVSANFSKRFLRGVDSLTVATGSMIAAAVVLLPMGAVHWPAAAIPAGSWLSAIALAIACTGVAYIIYFHLIAAVGPAKAVSVTFLIPIFGILWGMLFLHETLSVSMVLGCAVVIVGTLLASGMIRRPLSFGRPSSRNLRK